MKRINWWVKKLIKALKKKDLIEEWLPKVFTLRKKMWGEVLNEVNWHKRMAKRIYMLFEIENPE